MWHVFQVYAEGGLGAEEGDGGAPTAMVDATAAIATTAEFLKAAPPFPRGTTAAGEISDDDAGACVAGQSAQRKKKKGKKR